MKRLLRPLLLAMAATMLLCMSAFADDDAAGFYNITPGTGLTIKAGTISNKVFTAVTKSVSANVNTANDTPDTTYEKFYPATDALQVTLSSATKDKQYLAVLFTGDSPTEQTIFYIDQTKAETAGNLTITLYPKTGLPTNGTQLTLWITSDDGTEKRTATMYYAAAKTGGYTRQPYTLGDVDESGDLDVVDALWALQAAAGDREISSSQFLAADTDKSGDLDVVDALLILRVAAGEITLQ